MQDEHGEISHYVCSFYDISKEKEAARHIEQLAYYDDLCGLYNRRSLNDIMQRTLQEASGQWGALLLVDLDNFKSINDSSAMPAAICCCRRWWSGSRAAAGQPGAGPYLRVTNLPCCSALWARAMSPPRSWPSTSLAS